MGGRASALVQQRPVAAAQGRPWDTATQQGDVGEMFADAVAPCMHAKRHTCDIVETFAVFQLARFWLNLAAKRNKLTMLLTEATFHPPIG